MDIDLRTIETAEEAAPHLDLLATRGREALEELGMDDTPEDFTRRFVETRMSEPETLFLVAESTPGSADLGVCLVGPHEDPLSGERTPMVLVLSVSPSLRRHGLAPRKSWGQNFLHAREIHAQIVGAAGVGPGDTAIEIGAGLGTLARLHRAEAQVFFATENP